MATRRLWMYFFQCLPSLGRDDGAEAVGCALTEGCHDILATDPVTLALLGQCRVGLNQRQGSLCRCLGA
jgi:hypothetical protein